MINSAITEPQDGETPAANPREAFLAACAQAQASGDVALARVANRAAAALLDEDVALVDAKK